MAVSISICYKHSEAVKDSICRHLQAFSILNAQHAHLVAGQEQANALIGCLKGGHHICWRGAPVTQDILIR